MSSALTNGKRVNIDPRKLRNCSFSISIYTTEDIEPEFLKSVQENGILVPMVIRPDLSLIAGHRRRQHAIVAGLETVPCIVDAEQDELLVRRKILDHNIAREKTTEVRAREFAARLIIETELAERRKQATQATPGHKVGTNWSSPRNPEKSGVSGKADSNAAKQAGLSRTTARRAAKVVAEIDRLEDRGEIAKANELRATLNGKSVSAATKAIEPATVPTEFDEPIAGCDWMLKNALPRGIEFSIDIQKIGPGIINPERVQAAMQVLQEQFAGAKSRLQNLRAKRQRKSA